MTPLASKICGEIENDGAISFARFMELALYLPELGYYERQKQIGQRGDFYTSVSVGNLFGELLAFQFVEWFEKQDRANLQIIEAGAHDGQLAFDILNWLKRFRPTLLERLDYCVLEPSSRHENWQREKLGEFSEKVSWFQSWSVFSRSSARAPRFTIIFSNELFDAMPVHRFGWDAKKKTWFEGGVGFDGESFIWKRLLENQCSSVTFPKLPSELLDVLPDGFSTEICPTAIVWWKEAASFLDSGKLMAIDYGLLAEEFLTPERSDGTLRAYFRHHVNSDLLAQPGEQDLTAHVNFSALQEVGENAGLKTDALVSQTKFLSEIAGKVLPQPEIFGEWNAMRAKQFQTLTHPEHLGRSFRVLIQSR